MCMVTTFSGRQGARDARGRALRPVLRAGTGPPDQRVAALHDPAARGLHREAEERLRLAERAIRVARVRAARAAAERSHVDRDQAARAARDVRRVRRAVPRRSLGRVSGPGLVRASSAARRLVRRRVDPGLAERAKRRVDGRPTAPHLFPSHSHSEIRVTRHRPRDYTPRRALCKIRRLPAPLTLCSRLCDSNSKKHPASRIRELAHPAPLERHMRPVEVLRAPRGGRRSARCTAFCGEPTRSRATRARCGPTSARPIGL